MSPGPDSIEAVKKIVQRDLAECDSERTNPRTPVQPRRVGAFPQCMDRRKKAHNRAWSCRSNWL